MSDTTRKKIFNYGIIFAIICLPLVAISSPVLETIHGWNESKYKKLKKKKENAEKSFDEEQWQALKDRQKMLGDFYRLSFRTKNAKAVYENYLDWFDKDWETKQYLIVKFRLAAVLEELADQNMQKRTDYLKAATCHYQEIQKWYSPDQKKYREFVNKANQALRLRLEDYLGDCQ